MSTINERYFDASLRHQIGIRRMAAGETARVRAILEKADQELTAKLRVKLSRLAGKSFSTSDERVKSLLGSVRKLRRATMEEVKAEIRAMLLEFGKNEGDFELRMLKKSIFPIKLQLASAALETIRAAVLTKPFSATTGSSNSLSQWFRKLAAADRARLTESIQLGLAQGETVDVMVRRIAGTRAQGFTDGVLSITRRNAEAVVRTGINHVSNAARESVWDVNAGIIELLVWTATLDGRTTAICRARDGKVTTLEGGELPSNTERDPLEPQGARPPAHVSCRSVMTAVLNGQEIAGMRPSVVDTRTRRVREIDFRRQAREQGITIQTARERWATRVVGRVPAKTTYQQWLKRQPAGFQDEVLGKTKGALFRRGNVKLDKFVDRRGTELTLKQLAKIQPDAFVEANLNVEDFL